MKNSKGKSKSKIKVTGAMCIEGAKELDFYSIGDDKLEYAMDIYISMERARREAARKKRSIKMACAKERKKRKKIKMKLIREPL